MKNIISIICLSILFTSCASNSKQDSPAGEYVYKPVTNFFNANIDESELTLRLRQSKLQCENELMQLNFEVKKTAPRESSGNSVLDSMAQGARIIERTSAVGVLAAKKNKYFENCMELNGFVWTWAPLEEVEL
jgi:hypothetical protein